MIFILENNFFFHLKVFMLCFINFILEKKINANVIISLKKFKWVSEWERDFASFFCSRKKNIVKEKYLVYWTHLIINTIECTSAIFFQNDNNYDSIIVIFFAKKIKINKELQFFLHYLIFLKLIGLSLHCLRVLVHFSFSFFTSLEKKNDWTFASNGI